MFNSLGKLDQLFIHYVLPFGWKALGAFIAWVLGGMLIRTSQKLIRAALNRKKIDSTLTNYACTSTGAALKVILVVIILGIFGIETTSFSAILAAAGVAIGIAWSGLLSNLAAGIFLILLRPFKVGDTISAAGVSGTVKEIGLFATTIDTSDLLRVFVGNNKLFSDNILNYSSNRYRLILFRIQISGQVNPAEAILRLSTALKSLPLILHEPKIKGQIVELNASGTLIELQVPCSPSDYSDAYASGYQRLYEALKEANYPPIENKLILVEK